MSNQTKRVPTAQAETQIQDSFQESKPLEVLAQEFGKEAGARIGDALAEEIHKDPEVRRAAATGAGVGIGVVVGLALLSLATQ